MLSLLIAVALTGSDRLECVSARGRIEIALPAAMDPRIASMAVVKGGRWLTLVDDEHHLAPFRPGVRRLTLLPSRQTASYSDGAGRDRRTRAFPGPGTYRIVFSDNLETEPANMILRDCIVRVR